MTWMSLGSLALPHQLQRQGISLRNDLSRLAIEMATGEVQNPAVRLKGDLSALAAIAARSGRIDSLLQVTRQATSEAAAGQSALERVAQSADETSSRLLAVSTAGVDEAALRAAGSAAHGTLDDVLGTLSIEVAGVSLFAGTATDQTPLVSAEAMFGALSGLLATATSAADIAAIVDGAFLDPGGAFESAFYRGSAAGPGRAFDGAGAIPGTPTAAEPAIRRSLAGLVKAALVGDEAIVLSVGQRQALARDAALTLAGAEAGLTALQAVLGDGETRLASTEIRLTGERDGLALAREALIGVDPYEAATRLETAQTRLELIYTLTARTSRLSLAGYL